MDSSEGLDIQRKDSVFLVVDDENDISVTIAAWLRAAGHDCETAGNAADALNLVQQRFFHFVLADIVMPGGVDGLEMTRRIKAVSPSTQVIVMTGFSGDFSYDMAIEAGASDFIKKPFQFPELMARLRLARIHEEYRSLSITDDLTGLYNRRGFLTLADHMLKLSLREKTGMFLLYADVDDLKGINDAFGHQEGDSALIEFGKALRQGYRQSDIVARIGGDEFIVFPVGDCREDPEAIVRRLTEIIGSFGTQRVKPYPVGISYGISYFDPDNPCSLVELVSRADKEMYAQKNSKKHVEKNNPEGPLS